MATAGMRGGFRWELAPPWQQAREVAAATRTSPLIAQILHNRGLSTSEDFSRFLNPKLTDLHPPELLPGVQAAAARICQAVRAGERICIYGDYDVDGMTATAILYRCLALHKASVDFYVPHRLEEGYGVNVAAIEQIAAAGAKLLVTVDCGISAVGPLARANELGMDVIVTDHHAPDAVLPAAIAIVHPSLDRLAGYPNPNLSGAGVAFKLAWEVARQLCGRPKVDEPTREFLLEATTLAALGTIADVVPLIGENRVLASYGLKGLSATRHVGLRALLESAGLTGEKVNSYHVGFCLAPRLNACGRMGHARSAVELLACADAERCKWIAQHLESANRQRQQVEHEIFQQAAAMVESGNLPAPADHAIVLASEAWHAGVVGIVASRLVERFGKPAVVIALHGGQGSGSARSIPGFHMRDALAACSAHVIRSGGHAMAGGLKLAQANVEAFARCFAQYAREHISAAALTPVLAIDAEAHLGELDFRAVEHFEKLAPFGQGNPRPVVAIRGCRILTPPQRIGRSGQTISFLAGQALPSGSGVSGPGSSASAAGIPTSRAGSQSPPMARIRCVGFQMAELADKLQGVNVIDLAGEPVLNHFNGRTSVEMHIKDVAIPS